MANKENKSVSLDQDLLKWFDKTDNASSEIRKALRLYLFIKDEFKNEEIEYRTKRAVKYYKKIEKKFEEEIGLNYVNSNNKIEDNFSKKIKDEKEIEEDSQHTNEEKKELENNLDKL